MIYKILWKKKRSIRYKFFTKSLLTNCLLLLIPIMMIGPYSVVQSTKDNTAAIGKSTYQTLNQLEKTMDLLYSHIDNANIFFSSNPRVTIQLKRAFNEHSLSLDSLKNLENLSLYFQNLIYTDQYIENVYVYYENDNNRIYLPQKGAIHTVTAPDEEQFLQTYKHSQDKDLWLEVKKNKSPYSSAFGDSLMIYQRLYTRSGLKPAGLIAFEYNLTKLEQYFGTLMQYEKQTVYLVDENQNIIYTNSQAPSPRDELNSLYPILSQEEEAHLFDLENGSVYNKAAYLKSPRTNGLTYFTFTPSSEIYKTTRNFSGTYLLLTFSGILLSFLLAFYKTNREYQYINQLIDIFSNPDEAQQYFDRSKENAANPFEFIMLNVIRLFLDQKYLKIQASERDYRMQTLKMQALQHQINPHFLHNTLNIIYWEAVRLTSSENSCSFMVSNLSSVMRYSLSDPQETVTIKEEISYLKTYLDIMKSRYTDRFNIHYRIDESCTIYSIKKMILQPLVENSIYHGIKAKEGKGTIWTGIRKLKNSILIYILDDGVGIPPEKLHDIRNRLGKTSGDCADHIGLTNTNLRLTLAYGDKAGLHLKSVYGKYTLVYFLLPLN